LALHPSSSLFPYTTLFRSTFFPEWIDGKPQADARDLPYKTSGGYFQGMLAEYVIVSENALVASPESLDDAEASTLPCAGLTAWLDRKSTRLNSSHVKISYA